MNVFQFSAVNEAIIAKVFAESGYEKISTFFGDLSIAEWHGTNAIEDTYKRVVESWKTDVKMFTEFVMCLNHKSWQYYEYAEHGIDKLPQEMQTILKQMPLEDYSRLYADLYYKAVDMVYKTFDEEGQIYFFNVTD